MSVMHSFLAALRRNALYKGLFGGSRGWLKEQLGHSSDAMSLNYTQISRVLTAAAIAQIPSLEKAA